MYVRKNILSGDMEIARMTAKVNLRMKTPSELWYCILESKERKGGYHMYTAALFLKFCTAGAVLALFGSS